MDELREMAISASRGNNLEVLKKSLTALGFYREAHPFQKVFNKFRDIANNIFKDSSTLRGERDFLQLLMLHSLENNNLEFSKFLLDSSELRINVDIDNSYIWERLVKLENIELLHYLMNHKKTSGKNIAENIVSALEYCLYEVNAQSFKYLLTDTKMPYHKEVLTLLKARYIDDTPVSNFSIFVKACSENKTDLVEVLFEHEDYRLMINKNSFIKGLESSCSFKHVELMMFLLTTNKSPFVPYVDYDPIGLLEISCRRGYQQIVKSLVWDFKIKAPSDFEEFSRNVKKRINLTDFGMLFERRHWDKNILAIKDEFSKRKLYDDLQDNLETKSGTTKPKTKI